MPRSRKQPWRSVFAQIERSRGTGPRATGQEVLVTVGRGPVPRRASVEETALVGVRFSRSASARGGQAPALREKTVLHCRARACPSPCLGRGNSRGVRFSRSASARGGQAPALREKTVLHCRARACPSPCLGRGNSRGVRFSRSASARGGQAPALRTKKFSSP